MNCVSVVWENVNFVCGLGSLKDIKRDETMYTLGNFPGILFYKGETKTLKYFDGSKSPDLEVLKRIVMIVSLWVEKTPVKIEIPAKEDN